MRYLIVLFLLLSGCATVSEYGKGCRDGVTHVVSLTQNEGGIFHNKEMVDNFCNMLETRRKKD